MLEAARATRRLRKEGNGACGHDGTIYTQCWASRLRKIIFWWFIKVCYSWEWVVRAGCSSSALHLGTTFSYSTILSRIGRSGVCSMHQETVNTVFSFALEENYFGGFIKSCYIFEGYLWEVALCAWGQLFRTPLTPQQFGSGQKALRTFVLGLYCLGLGRAVLVPCIKTPLILELNKIKVALGV